MIPLSIFKELFDYHYWARDQQLKACASLSQEQFLKPLGNSFPSARDTLAHMVIAEWAWLERWNGRTPEEAPSFEECTSVDAVAERWRATEEDMRSYLAGINLLKLGQKFSYSNSKGKQLTFELWQTLYHLLNHQSYHRGQVTTLLRQLGAQPPPVDFASAYLAEKK